MLWPLGLPSQESVPYNLESDEFNRLSREYLQSWPSGSLSLILFSMIALLVQSVIYNYTSLSSVNEIVEVLSFMNYSMPIANGNGTAMGMGN